MGVESQTENQTTGELASLQNTLDSEQVTFSDTLANEIEAVVEETSSLHRYDYVVGMVSNYFIKENHVHFDIVHRNTPLHCVIFEQRRSSVTTDLEEGMKVAVTGDLGFHAPKNYCSIEATNVVVIEENRPQRFYERIPTFVLIILVGLFLILLLFGGYIVLS